MQPEPVNNVHNSESLASSILTSWVKPVPNKPGLKDPSVPCSFTENAETLETIITCIKTGNNFYGIPFIPLINKIRESVPKDRIGWKLQLQAFLPGIYKATGRHSDKIRSFQIMVFDLDHLKDYEAALSLTKSIPEVLFSFKSPSGDGLKVVIGFTKPFTTADSKEKLSVVYTRLYRYFSEKFFQLPELDDVTVDAGRLCFLSYDPDIYVNPTPTLIEINGKVLDAAKELEKTSPHIEVSTAFKRIEYPDGVIPDFLQKEIELASKFIICPDYDTWLKISFSLCKLGEFGYKVFQSISKQSPKYKNTEKEILNQWENSVKSAKKENGVTLGTFFYEAKAAGYVPSLNFLTSIKRLASKEVNVFWEFTYKRKKKPKGPKEPKKTETKKETDLSELTEISELNLYDETHEETSKPIVEEDKTGDREVNFPDILIHQFLNKHGFYRNIYKGDTINTISWVYAKDNIVSQTSVSDMIHYLKDHIDSYKMPDSDRFEVLSTFLSKHAELFRQSKYAPLPHIKLDFLRDTATHSYLYFRNGWLEITKEGAKLKPYTELKKHILKADIIDKDFSIDLNLKDFSFYRFLQNITLFPENPEGSHERFVSLICAMGYLMNRHCASEEAIILTDEIISPDGDANGGTGKSLIGKAVSKVRRVSEIDGKTFTTEKNFLYQGIDENTNVIFYNDVKQKFKFDDVFNICSEGIEIEKKYKQSFRIEGDHRPKVLITTNYAITGDGSSYERRQYTVELNSCYTPEHRPIDDFGKAFFEWDEKEWNCFYNLMVVCIQTYLKVGLVKQVHVNQELKKTIATVSEVFFNYFTPEKLVDYIVSSKDHYLQIDTLQAVYISDCNLKNYPLNYFSKNLSVLIKYYKLDLIKSRLIREGSLGSYVSLKVRPDTHNAILEEIAKREPSGIKEEEESLDSLLDDL